MAYSPIPILVIALSPLITSLVQQIIQLWVMYNPPQWMMQYAMMMFNAIVMLAMAMMIGQVMGAIVKSFSYFRW